MRSRTRVAASLAITFSLIACGSAGPGGDPAETTATEVFDTDGASLGSIALETTCTEDANASLRLGMALLHNMTYTRAQAAFEEAAEQDPACTLAPWGVAMTFVHPLWPDAPSEAQLARGWTLLEDARARGPKSSLEEGYLTALEAYYRDGAARDEPARLATYAKAWEAVAAAHPADVEATLFRALSLMATAFGDFETQLAAGRMAEEILEQIPDHPGAQHYVIHAYDLPDLANQALPVANTYGQVAPDNAHALHMTSHIFTRVGLWEESIDYNRRSAAVALGEPIGGRTSHHYLHSIDYLAYAYLQRADDAAAEQVLADLQALEGPAVEHAASAYAWAAIPARLALERHRWNDAALLVPRWRADVAWERYPELEAITEFARALGAAHIGDFPAADAALDRIRALHAETVKRKTPYDWGKSVRILELSGQAWVEYARGRTDAALTVMREAAALEADHPKQAVTPGEVLPAGELLGDMLLDLERYDDARAAYEASLTRSPNRFNSLYGAGLAAERAGNGSAAADYYRQLLAITAAVEPGRPERRHAEAFLARQGT